MQGKVTAVSNHRIMLVCGFLAIILVFAAGCGDDDRIVNSDPHAPIFGAFHLPSNMSTDNPLTVSLSWTASDPDDDPLEFKLLFGSTNQPPVMDSGLTDTTYEVTNLAPNTRYYWRVVATDTTGRSAVSATRYFETVSSLVYPVAVGNRWEYTGIMYADSLDLDGPPSEPIQTLIDTIDWSSVVEVMSGDTLRDTLATFRFREQVTEETNVLPESFSWMANAGSGFWAYAYKGLAAKGTPVRPMAVNILFNGELFSSVYELRERILNCTIAGSAGDTTFWDPPALSLKYPLAVDSQWTYRPEGSPWRMDKRAVGTVEVQTAAGTFNCYRIQRLYDIDDGGSWDEDISGYDYVADVGLIKRTLRITLLLVNVYADTVGTYDFVDECILTAYGLQ
ncbi:MAG: fibronectin type III domain-containing protein [Candidatus Zixiibacteriota bacterium]|nr:MAG: fibronectin type III domain-containing protein [candidate division Zixibacteria bacterium]